MTETTDFKEREGRQLEFKEQVDSLSTLFPSIIAFSNDIGGRILIGIRDRNREIIGLSDEQIDILLERTPQAIADAIQPLIRPRLRVLNIAGQNVIEIQVFPGSHKPYFLASKGLENGTYMRFGTHNKRVKGALLKDLQRETQGKYLDQETIEKANICDLNDKLFRDLYKQTFNDELLQAEHIIARDPISQELKPTIAGLIFLGTKPTSFLPSAEVLYTTFADEKIDLPTKTIDLSMPLPILIEELMRLLLPELSLKKTLSGAQLKSSKYEIPPAALREALLNACIHRKYDLEDAIKVSVFSDRVEILSPGNFPGPLQDYFSGISYARNPHLRQLARKSGLVEKRGLGFRLMFQACNDNGNPPPDIVEQPTSVRVVLWRIFDSSLKEALPSELNALEPFAKSKESFTNSEAAKLLGLSKNTARKYLQELIDKKILEVRGKGRATKYYWT